MYSEAVAPSQQVYSNLLNSYRLSYSRDSQQHCCFNGSEFDFCINMFLNLLKVSLSWGYKKWKSFEKTVEF